MQGVKKWVLNGILFFGILALTLYGLLHETDPKRLFSLLSMANGGYWTAGVVLVIVFICCESWILYILLTGQKKKVRPGHCILYSFVGFFFSCITPSAGGGQPAEVYFMHRDGINAEVSTPVLILVTMAYKLVLVIYGIGITLFRPAEIMSAPPAVRWWGLAGWLLNVLVIVLYGMTLLKPKIVSWLAAKVIRLVGRFMRPGRTEKMQKRMDRFMKKFEQAAVVMKQDRRRLVYIVLISILQRTILFSVTYLTVRSFHIRAGSLPGIVSLQAMVSLGTDMLPLPGGTGASEPMFLMLFEGICGESMVLPVLLVSRAISYYGQTVISGLVTLAARLTVWKKQDE